MFFMIVQNIQTSIYVLLFLMVYVVVGFTIISLFYHVSYKKLLLFNDKKWAFVQKKNS